MLAFPPGPRHVRGAMSITVKICGVSTDEALDAALEGGADMVGFVFFPRSPRHLELRDAARLAARARDRIAIVALTVDAPQAELAAIVETVRPDALQLHGHESPERVAAVRTSFRLPVMKALALAEAADLAAAEPYAAIADRLVFDARPPRDATRPGGLGVPFDWHLLAGVRPRIPFILSGGLGPHNVVEAVEITRAGGVDVSSGVERAPGHKDPDKIRDFIRAARGVPRTAWPERMARPA